MPWWLIQGKTEIANNVPQNSNSALQKILTNLEELSFLTVLAFPKAGEREKQRWQPNLSVKKYLNAKKKKIIYDCLYI